MPRKARAYATMVGLEMSVNITRAMVQSVATMAAALPLVRRTTRVHANLDTMANDATFLALGFVRAIMANSPLGVKEPMETVESTASDKVVAVRMTM